MADDAAREPMATTPKRRSAARRPKALAEAPAVIAPHTEVHRGAVGRVEADSVTVAQGAIGAARAEQVTIDRGAIGAAVGGQVEIRNGYARSILARQVQLDRGAARVVIAADVRTNQTAVMFLVARKVAGDVRVLLDWRGALAFGAAAGLVFALLRRGRRRDIETPRGRPKRS